MERFRGRSFFRGLSWSYCKTRRVKKVELDVGVEYPVRLARQHDRVAPQPHHEADDQHLKLNVSEYINQIPNIDFQTQPKNPQIQFSKQLCAGK